MGSGVGDRATARRMMLGCAVAAMLPLSAPAHAQTVPAVPKAVEPEPQFTPASPSAVQPESQGAQALRAAVKPEPRGVVELFTSQGCSSCPPADKLIGELSSDPSLVTISLPIDYWDYLGWKDTLANPLNSALQRGYARTRGDREVYTPQVVINGSVHAVGSDREAIEQALTQTHHDGVLSLPVKLAVAGGNLSVQVGRSSAAAAADQKNAEVWVCALSHAVAVTINRGENRGRTITYHNVARRWVKLGEFNGNIGSWSLPVAELKSDGADAAAVLVQAGTADKPGPVLGAAETPLR